MIETTVLAGQLATRSTTDIAIDAAAITVGLVFDTSQWIDPAVKCSAQFEVSDDGVKFTPLGGFVNESGGHPLSPVVVMFQIAGKNTSTRKARCTLDPTAAISTTIKLRTLDGTEPKVTSVVA